MYEISIAPFASVPSSGFDIVDFLNQTGQFVKDNSAVLNLVAIIISGLFLVREWHMSRLEQRKDERQQYAVDIQRRRLSEHNIDLRIRARLFNHHEARGDQIGPPTKPFVVASVDLNNIGDGPVDMLACLVAGRALDDLKVPGLATQARDVGWEDLVPYFWNNEQIFGPPASHPLFTGLSTTKNITYSPEQVVRLDPKQHEELIRIDAITNLEEMYERGHINLEYKVFTVALGYPLLDVRGSGDESERLHLYKLDLARPNYTRWANLERALDTVNRFTFRLALNGLQAREQQTQYWVNDPLGRLAHAEAFRCFLLYHWDFLEEVGAAPPGAPNPRAAERQSMRRVNDVKDEVQERYHVYDPPSEQAADYPQRFADASDYCYRALTPLVDAWKQLNEKIDFCTKGAGSFDELIKKDPESKARWDALQADGYFLTRVPDKRLIPSDLLALERYAIRTTYVLVTVKAPGHDKGRHHSEI